MNEGILLALDKPHTEIATLGGGCFWCTEAIFKRLIGVLSVKPGFAGGHTINPTWEDVCRGKTGHAESVQVEFNPTQIAFEDILNVFFHTHDPTTPNQQGNDKGTEYRSVIFYHDRDQKFKADNAIKEFERKKLFKSPIVTEITPFTIFYPAEEYHKNFYESGHRPDYCYYIIDPKIGALMQKYGHMVKENFQ